MKTTTYAVCAAMIGALLAAAPAEARRHHRGKRAVGITDNNTGGRPNRVIGTRAGTITNNSAAGGNASQPSRRVPGGSSGGGSGGSND